MTLLSELIEIPEQVHKGDFVLRLTEGVGRRRDARQLRRHAPVGALLQ